MLDDFFASLNAEIETELAKTKAASNAEALKKKAHNMRLDPKTRAAAGEEYKAIQAALEAEQWITVSTTALFTEQSCDGCGSVHHIFLQFMECQQLKRKPTTQRWARVTRPSTHSDLPRKTLIQPHRTHLCADCCQDHGFYLSSAEALLPTAQASVPSLTYVQEDLNAPSA
jgi:hypothetical protein